MHSTRPKTGDVSRTTLEEAAAEGRAAWPGVTLSDEDFAEHVERVVKKVAGADASPSAPPDLVSTLRIPELFLAAAAARGDAAAMKLVEARYFDEIDAAYRRFPGLPLPLEDVRQRMREKLFLGEAPALAGYAGQGELRAWLRATALHMLLNVSTRESREVATDDAFFEAVTDLAGTAESVYVKRACAMEFKEAFTEALGQLSARERTLLKYVFADGLGVDEVGAIHRVHRATAARWIASARRNLVRETRVRLRRRLDIDEAEANSIVRGALSVVGTTLLRRFG